MKILIPHYGIRRISDNQLMMSGDGNFITSPNKEVIEEYIAFMPNSSSFKISEFTPTEITLMLEEK
jgi:hypothetical protein